MNKLSLAIACGFSTMFIATTGVSAEKTFSIGGDVEYDITAKDDGQSDFAHGGRVKLNAVGMVKGETGYFAKGVVQPTTGIAGGGFGSDDVYFQFGKTDAWDLRMGRFEGVNLLPAGKDTVVEKAADVGYNAGAFRGRDDNHVALTVGSGTGFGFELGLLHGKLDDNKISSAVRPVVTYDTGSMKFHAGIESGEKAGADYEGFGVGVSAALGGGSLGLAYADGGLENAEASSINLNYVKDSWGIGYMHDENDADVSADTFYAAYTMPLLGLKDASVTFAASTSSADNAEDVNALRTRFNYTF